MAGHPTNKKRTARQRLKAQYAKLREDAQLYGIIDTVPEGAVRSERVDSTSQDEQRFPGLDRQAIRNDGNGWSVPEHVKRKVIEKTAEVIFAAPKIVVDDKGVEKEVPIDPMLQLQAAKTLMLADKQQWERDEPEEAGKAAGATQNTIVDVGELLARAKAQREIKHTTIDVTPEQPSAGTS